MTTSDLVARLTARANLTYSYPIEDILLFRSAAAEIARLREALEGVIRIADRDCPEFRAARAALAEQEKDQ